MKYTFSKKYGGDSLLTYIKANLNGFTGGFHISEQTGVSEITFTDSYTNDNTLIPMNTEVLPTKESIESAMVAFEVSEVARETRRKAYPEMQEQLDMQYHDKKDGTTTWEDAVKAVKDANPKA